MPVRSRADAVPDMSPAILLVAVLLRVGCVSCASWTGVAWECREGRCVRSEEARSLAVPLQQTSQAVCRLYCGQYGALWPRPTGPTTIGHQVVSLDPGRISVVVSVPPRASRSPSSPLGVSAQAVVQEAARELDVLLKRMCEQGCVPGDHALAVTVNTTSAEDRLDWDSDESYRLHVITNGGVVRAQVQAATAWGARHAMQTLSQLISGTSISGTSPGAPAKTMLAGVSGARVQDAPRFAHRGVLLDSARHYLPLSALLRTVDAMAASRLNVLHWHATDSHSFPLALPSAPQMARLGAYGPREVYTPAAVARLARYARLRGVRLLVELDAPAHCSAGWGWGEAAGVGPLVLCAGAQPWRSFCVQPPCGQLNPTNPMVYAVLEGLYADLLRLLPAGEALHLGGDEVFFPCWNASVEVTDYLRASGRGRAEGDFLQLWAEFHAGSLDALDQAAGHRRTPAVLWSSQLTRPPHVQRFLDRRRYVIETWTVAGDPLPEELLASGYRVILAAKDAWYLDHGWWGRTTYRSWRTVRDRRLPRVTKAARAAGGAVLGGEVALWGELVDAATLDTKLWPRAAAAAERFWSDPTESSTAPGVEARFLAHRDRLLGMGVNAEAVAPEWCQLNEGECS